MKELIEKLKELNYSNEFIEHIENSVLSQNEFQEPNFDYENIEQTTNDSSELYLMESQEAQSDLYIVHSNN